MKDFLKFRAGRISSGYLAILTVLIPILTNAQLVPAISNFNPISGTVGAGINISGTNFSPMAAANIVYFGAVRANVLAASPNSLTVTVPTGATYAPITVTVNGLVAYSAAAFEPTFAGSGAAIDAATFAPGVNLGASSPITTVIADLDGDGKPDLVVANVYANSISIYQNIGSNGVLNAASFAAPVVFSVGSGSEDPIGVTVADVDGDGKLDLLVPDRNNNQIAVYRNISSGGTLTANSFAPPVFFAVAADPRQVVVCDLDGDGHPDIISVNYSSGTISILRNIGAAGSISTNSFAPRVDLALAGNSEWVAVGDLDGDGKPDLAVADSSGFISLFRNHCTPGNISASTFDARVDLPAQSGSLNVVIGDLDGDGRPELITSAYLPQTMSVYRNLSTPGSLTTNSFAASVDYALAGRGHTIALGDINGDGQPDIAEVTELSSVLSLFQNIGTGSFTNTSLAARVDFAAGWNAWGVAVGDLDGDGRPDVVFGNVYDNTLTLYKNVITFGTPPVITTQPMDQNVVVGGTATFAVAAQSASPLNYQWSFNGTNLPGATNVSLTLTNVQLIQAGIYAVLVANASGSIISSNAVLTVLPQVTNNPQLINVDYGSGGARGYSLKTGFAAIGQTTNDFWNFYDRDASATPGDWRSSGTLVNLQSADGTATTVGMSVSDAPGAWGDASTDPMYMTYDYPLDGGNNVVTFTNLPPGQYDVLAYSVDGNYEVTVGVISYGVKTTYDSPVSSVPVWTEGVQYARWRSVPVTAGQPLVLTVRNGTGGYAILSGVQVLNSTPALPLCTPAPAGMVGWWKGDGNGNDSVGSNNGILENITFTSGMAGQAFYLNGSNADVQLPYSTSLQPTSVTVEAWVKLDALASPVAAYPGLQYLVFKKNSRSGLFEGYDLEKNRVNGQDVFRFQVTSAGGQQVPAASMTVPQVGVWYHLAGTYDGSSGYVKLYVNGALEGSAYAGFPLDYGTRPVFIGTTGEGWDGKVQGAMDEVSIYNRALSSNEIADIYNAGSAGKCTTTSPAVPVIFSFAPASGTSGTGVTISGTNFSPTAAANIVYFGAVRANVLAASTTSLTVAVPTGATFAPITVTVNGLMAYANAPFLVTFAGGGSTVLAPRLDLPASNGPGFTAFADLDGDGKPDLLVLSGSAVSIYQNLGTNGTVTAGSFAPRVDWTLPTGMDAMTVADADGDGRLDIVLLNESLNQVMILKNLSTPGILTTSSFAAPVVFSTGTDPRGLAVQDLDGDGKPELIVGNWGDNTVSVFHNTGASGITTNSFAPAVTFAVGASPQGLAVADLDGDGQPDIVTANNNYGTDSSVSILRNTSSLGNISFAPHVDLAGLPTSYCVAIGDLDGDGKLDVAVSSFANGQAVSVYRNTSTPGSLTTSSFAPHVDFDAGGWGNALAIGDLEGDGKPDLAVVTQLPDHMSIFKNISTPGSFTTSSLAPRADYPTGWNPNGVAIGDLDGDGRPEIAFAVSYAATLSIYQNQTPFGTPPVFTTQPTNQNVAVGGTASFSGVASGTGPLIYQWSFNGTNLSGATNSFLTLTNVQLGEAGNYVLQVTNNFGSAVSSNAVLSVFVPAVPPTILSQTPNQVVLLGNTATFSVTAAGTDPLSYFWKRNGVLIPGATNSSYSLNNAQLSDSGSKFSCLVTNAFGSAASTIVSLKVIDTMANDLCSGAIVITNARYTNVQSTLKASSFGDPAPDCVDGFGHGVWYQFTAPVAGRLIVDTFGSDFDTGLALYIGACETLTEVACNDDTGGVTSQVILPTTAGTTYFILAGGYSSDAGNLVLHLNHLTPPAFVVQPTNLAVVVSSNASFVTTVVGTQPIVFQWYFNNAPLAEGGRISGSTNATLNIANVLTNDAGSYQVVASNLIGVVTSSVAILTPIILPPVITQPPADQSVLVGSNATFTAGVDGTPPYSYQWSFNGNPLADDGIQIAGSLTGSLTISNLTTADAGSYSLTVTNISGSASAAAVLTVLVPPVITLQPVGRSVPPGLPTVFTASASGIPAPNYQWQLNGTNISGATGANYTNAAVGTNDLGFYQVVANNSVGSVTSSVAQLTFGPVAAWGRNLSGECLPPPALGNVIAIAGTLGASFAVRADGTIAAWGGGRITNTPASASNVVSVAISPGSLDGAAALRSDGTVVAMDPPPSMPTTLSNIVSVSVGDFRFGFALRAEGTLVGWGSAPYGTAPAGLNHVAAIACGYTHSLALRNDGTVLAWGSGLATNVPAGLSNVTAVAAGYSHSLALKSNGTVVAWGSGSGTNLPAGLTNIAAISASGSSQGQSLSIAIRYNGTVVAWGDNVFSETNPPAALNNLVSVAGAAAAYHGLALVNDGSPQILRPPIGLTAYIGRDVMLQASAVGAAPLNYQWLLNGTNVPGATNTSLVVSNIQFANAGNYQLFVSNSINTTLSLPAPLTVISNNTLVFLSQTSVSSSNVYQGGTARFYGGAVQGNGPLRYQWFSSPTNKNYTAISGATSDTFVLDPALAVQSGNYYLAVSNLVGGVTSAPVNIKVLFARAWGFQAVSNPPVNVTNAIAVATGGYNNYNGDYFALGADGKLASWANYFPVYGETNVSALSNSIVTAIAAGAQHSLALKSDGTVYAWGFGGYGQTNPPANLNTVVAIACGGYHDLALKADGTVVGWGATLQAPNYGQAANNPAATNVVAIAAGAQHSLALRADGTVVGWGYPYDGSTNPPPTATNAVAIAAGSGFSAALRANGTVVQWGSGMASYPVPSNLSNVVAISGSGTHCTALRNDGTVVSWGYEYVGLASNNVPSDLANVVRIASGADHDFALLGTRAPAFTVQPWNRTVSQTAAAKISMTGKCAGVQPVSYQWMLNGTNLPGATNDTLVLTNQPSPAQPVRLLQGGDYQLVASNAYGVAVSKPAKVTLVYPLADALNTPTDGKGNPPYSWTTSGSAQWYGQTNISHDGVAAARSGGIGPLQETILQTTLATNWSGRATFWWKVSSEQYFDTLEFRVNGTVQSVISGEVDWQPMSIPLAAGTNLLQWRYSKDYTFDSGLDAGFVDQFAFVPDPPTITLQPVSQIVNMGASVTFSVAATGAPAIPGSLRLNYQWQKNGTPIGGNGPLLSLSNVGRAQNGTYFVTVTGAGGSTVSSNAVLKVLVPQLLGTPTLSPDGTLRFTSTDANGGLLQPSDLANFEAQASTNLVDWVTLPNALSLTNGMLELQDNSGTNWPERFYRLLEH